MGLIDSFPLASDIHSLCRQGCCLDCLQRESFPAPIFDRGEADELFHIYPLNHIRSLFASDGGLSGDVASGGATHVVLPTQRAQSALLRPPILHIRSHGAVESL